MVHMLLFEELWSHDSELRICPYAKLPLNPQVALWALNEGNKEQTGLDSPPLL